MNLVFFFLFHCTFSFFSAFSLKMASVLFMYIYKVHPFGSKANVTYWVNGSRFDSWLYHELSIVWALVFIDPVTFYVDLIFRNFIS